MIRCPNCNTPTEDYLKFCSNCGANLQTGMTGNVSNQSSFQDDSPVQQYTGNQTQQQPPAEDPYYQQQPSVKSSYYQQQPSAGDPYYQQPPSGGSYYQQQPPAGSSSYQRYQPNNTRRVNRPVGITLIAIYEIIIGGIIVLFSLLFYLFAFSSNTRLNGALVGKNYHLIFFVLGTIIIAWGLLGIVGAVLFLRGKHSGYIMSIMFLITAGILLFALYFIPTIVMVVSLVYFFTNKNFKATFHAMKNTGH